MSRETIRRDWLDAAGEAFLPSGWQRLVAAIPALLAVADAAVALMPPVGELDEEDWAPEFVVLRDALAALEALP